ncbi:MAG: D-alanine--D-alanine ligase [bacterium]|nr:D-alanine--D-alanine ligase [bacterium]MDY2650461.1 D-alanine--D-alanine ligase [Candidatus Egerieousia sp.]MDY3134554.1 D-alanine--D-alanine ligase [Candidatus Egerieousia sp.]MDY5024750.1 D-alanine--D-alanine ligase [Candidatus Egerieousia sp.]
MAKKSVAVIYGGNSSEHQVSIQSGKNVAANLDRERYDVYEILIKGKSWTLIARNGEEMEPAEINKTDFSAAGVHFDVAFIMIHGTPGENGLLQGYFEMLEIPFTTCNAFVSNIAFDKYSCKRFLDFAGVKFAKDCYIRKGRPYSPRSIVAQLGLPLFIKPTNGGSSFGVTKVKSMEEIEPAVERAFLENDAVMAEEAIVGREVTNGIFTDRGKIVNLPVTEIVTEREFFDFEAKYQGLSKEICPAPLPPHITEQIQQMTTHIYTFMGCSGLVRMDYIIKGEEIFFLEMNMVPGMTPMSLIPAQVRAAGIEIKEFFTALIESAK